MARYRRTDADLAYGDPQPERWDSSRFSRESQFRQAPVIEERPPYPSARRGAPVYEDDRYYAEYDRYGPRGYQERRYFEEDDYYDPRAGQGAMVPFRPERPPRPGPPARPAMIRRQSSVDRIDFERRESRRYYDDYRPPPPPPPPAQDFRQSRADSRYYDDIRIQDPEYYGDDGFREYREREWVRSRSRNDELSPGRRPSEFVNVPPPVEERVEERVVEEEKVVEKPYPRRGKTRMPRRLVHTKVLFDLGYPYYELDEKTILIEKALGPENIDEIFAKSKEYRERETITTRLIEAPPPASSVHTKPLSEAPRSVREWDHMSFTRERSISPESSVSRSTRRSKSQGGRRASMHESLHASRTVIDHERDPSPARTARSRKSRAKSRRSSSSDDTTIIEKKTIISERVSPTRTVKSRRRSSVGGTEIIERRKTIIEDDVGESNSIALPLALVENRSKSRTDREIREEIRRLEDERRDLRRETDVVIRSRRDGSPGLLMEPPPVGEIRIDRRGEEVVEVRKDKRARSRSRPPGPALLKSMMYTVT